MVLVLGNIKMTIFRKIREVIVYLFCKTYR